MDDTTTTLEQLKKNVQEFVREREWEQYHTPKNLSMAIATEAAEVMEPFKWVKSDDSLEHFKQHRAEIEDEIADVLITVLCFANSTGIDISSAFKKKLAEIKKKYPVQKAKGRADKYTAYE
jgi:NTP pyrophosphatase (non-canonical NTP hydrolase)